MPTACIAILGPTCSGKSSIALALAEALGTAIISCDSMQVYQGMDIGTAKPSLAQRQRVPHHLVDILDIHKPFNTNMFVQEARRIMAQRPQDAATPTVLAGGTGLYARALIYALPLLPSDKLIFQAICAQAEQPDGLEQLLAELTRADAELAERLKPNPRRVMRAVEVLRCCGKASGLELLSAQSSPQARAGVQQIILMPEAELHRTWIAQRTAAMLQDGWIDETEQLLQRGWRQTPTAQQALGYREIAAYLDRQSGAASSRAELQQRLVWRTCQYARRQRTWFRNQHPGATILPLRSVPDAEKIAAAILAGKFLTSY